MPATHMRLKILLPFHVFLDQRDVLRIVAESRNGLFGLLPNRQDYVAPLAAGILTYTTAAEGEVCLAVDEGVLVKTGNEVLVSVHNAIGGEDLESLHEAIVREFLSQDAQEKSIHAVLAKLEGGFIRRLAALNHE